MKFSLWGFLATAFILAMLIYFGILAIVMAL